jgi:hypothetical protein
MLTTLSSAICLFKETLELYNLRSDTFNQFPVVAFPKFREHVIVEMYTYYNLTCKNKFLPHFILFFFDGIIINLLCIRILLYLGKEKLAENCDHNIDPWPHWRCKFYKTPWVA